MAIHDAKIRRENKFLMHKKKLFLKSAKGLTFKNNFDEKFKENRNKNNSKVHNNLKYSSQNVHPLSKP